MPTTFFICARESAIQISQAVKRNDLIKNKAVADSEERGKKWQM